MATSQLSSRCEAETAAHSAADPGSIHTAAVVVRHTATVEVLPGSGGAMGAILVQCLPATCFRRVGCQGTAEGALRAEIDHG